MSLRFPGTDAKELPEEYRERKRPQYSRMSNIGRCRPISIHKGFLWIESGLAFHSHFETGEEWVSRRGRLA